MEDIVELKAESDRTRPAYVIGVDHKARQVGTGQGRAGPVCLCGATRACRMLAAAACLRYLLEVQQKPGLLGATFPTLAHPWTPGTHQYSPPRTQDMQVVLAFRGTTDLDDMLTDACATW